MKRFLVSAMMLGVFGLVTGCSEETKVEDKKTVETPGGKEVQKTTVETSKSGDAKTNP